MATVLKNARFKGDQKDRNIINYELVFVPIIWTRHFYVVCFNIKHHRVDVLDNSAVEDKLSIKDKYDGWVEKMHTAFANYLRLKKHLKHKIMKWAPVVKQKMEWRTTPNVVDCGIFTMRHMETYMGHIVGWTCGLTKEDASNQLRKDS
ncbi:putative Ulp1 protease family catalytic domain, papain-like cysteine peptidase superfamily [Helianthus anomalus]